MSAESTSSAAGEGYAAPFGDGLSRGTGMPAPAQGHVIGWLSSADGGPSWPGVLLHDDAMLVRAPRAALTDGAVDLRVQIASQDVVAGNAVAVQITEIRLLDVDGRPDPAVAMVRLSADPTLQVSPTINRSGFSIALRVTGDVWEAVRCLGLIPDRPPAPPVGRRATTAADIDSRHPRRSPARRVVRYLLVAVLTDEVDQMGVRMGPSAEGHPPSKPRGHLTAPTWLRRIDLLILPGVFLFDVLVFSRLLRADITSAERIAILCYSAMGVAILAFRRLAPLVVFAALWVHDAAALLVTTSYVPVIVLLVALESVAQRHPIRISLIALASMLVPTFLLAAAAAREASTAATTTAAVGSAVFYTVADVLAWAIGRWARRHGDRIDSLAQQHRQEVELHRQETEHAVSDERLRIARELHDIVAHSVTIMVLHAAGASRVVDTDPARAKESLATIEDSGQRAMGELRRLLELLRDSDEHPARSGSPLPGLAQLDQLIATVRGSGVDVHMDISGEPRRLDASVDLAAYRLIQEGLTNVVKHRGAGSLVNIGIEWGPDKVTVAVEDSGTGSSPAPSSLSTGNGLAGLRERIAIAGGDFAAGPTDNGGYRVAARLPVSGPIIGSGEPDPDEAAPDDEAASPTVSAAQVAPSALRNGSTQLARSDP